MFAFYYSTVCIWNTSGAEGPNFTISGELRDPIVMAKVDFLGSRESGATFPKVMQK